MENGNNKFFNQELKNKVVNLINQFEQKSTIEFVPCFIERSSDYSFLRLAGSLLLALLTNAIIAFVIPWSFDHYWIGILSAGLLTAVFYFSFSFFILKLPLKEIQKLLAQKVQSRAIQTFFEHKISQQAEGKGLLFYVSMLEKKFYLLPDHLLLQKFDQNFWNMQIVKLEKLLSQSTLPVAIESFLVELLAELEKAFPVVSTHDSKNHIENVWIDLKK